MTQTPIYRSSPKMARLQWGKAQTEARMKKLHGSLHKPGISEKLRSEDIFIVIFSDR